MDIVRHIEEQISVKKSKEEEQKLIDKEFIDRER